MKSAFASAAVLAFLTSGALAADAIALPVSTGNATVPLYDTQSFDWSGFYAGIYGAGQISPVGGLQYGLGVNLGVNAQIEYVLVGAEVSVHGLAGGPVATAYGQLVGRAGVLVSDDMLVYAAAGYGTSLAGPAESDLLLGGGLEYAVSEDVSLRAQYLHGFPITGGNPKDEVTLGAHFHF